MAEYVIKNVVNLTLISTFQCLLLLLLSHEIRGLDTNYPHQLVSGVYKEKLPSPIFYDSFIPIIYEYQLPTWNKSEVTFNNWYTCISETSPYKYTCPTVFHMNKAVLNLHIDFESLQPVHDSTPHADYYNALYSTYSFCDSIQKHFSGVFIQQDELTHYIEMLEKCHFDEPLNHIERSIEDYNYTIRAPFSKIENNYYNTYYKPMITGNTTLDLVASAALSNARTTIQATLLTSFYAEKYRWYHALQDCQQQLLPHSLVTLQKLNDTLTELAKKPSFESKYEFAIPLELMSKYYSLPLTDCTYTSNSFVVRLLFPIKLKTALSPEPTLSLYQFRPVPFHYSNKLCMVELYNEVEERLLHDSETDTTFATTCRPNSLCQISELTQANRIDHCAIAIVTNNFTATKENCEFECKDATRHVSADGLVTRVAADKFVVTSGSNASQIVYKCFGKSDEEISLVDVGALEITFPCKCQMIVNSRSYFSEFPCAETSSPMIVRIEPWHFHYSEKIDDESSSDVMASHYFLMKKLFYLHEFQQFFNLSGAISDESEDDDQESAQRHTAIPTHDSDSSHGLLWTFLIISTLTLLTLQTYIIYQLRLVRVHSSGSPTLLQSIMYNVRGTRTPDPEPELRLLNDQPQ